MLVFVNVCVCFCRYAVQDVHYLDYPALVALIDGGHEVILNIEFVADHPVLADIVNGESIADPLHVMQENKDSVSCYTRRNIHMCWYPPLCTMPTTTSPCSGIQSFNSVSVGAQ